MLSGMGNQLSSECRTKKSGDPSKEASRQKDEVDIEVQTRNKVQGKPREWV